jgi:cellulose biosynthesis protein BcsQ
MNKVQRLREMLDSQFSGNFELDVGAQGTAVLIVIDDSFAGQSRIARLNRVEPLLRSAGLTPGVTDLYTSEEAIDRSVALNKCPVIQPANWEQAVSMIDSGSVPMNRPISSQKLRRIVFYSYKGGVGRTTALVHTAFHLARAGQRVAVVDMDIEAPGLHLLLPRPDGQRVQHGLVDYLWERQVRPFDPQTREGLETCIVNAAGIPGEPIAYTVEDKDSRTQIHVIPAGVPGPEYVRRLHTLSSQDVLSRPDDAWSLFEQEITQQLDLDLMLIDARTGLGDWGGLSLLRLADEAFLVLYPSDQNLDGLRFVRDTLAQVSNINTHLVLSPVPDGLIGRELVGRFRPQLGLDDDDGPVEILYNPSIASAETYPVESAMVSYSRIANLIQDTQAQGRVEEIILTTNALEIIQSLEFPQRDAKSIAASDFEQFFQKTLDFERFLDDARWVVRGRKGTGKSTLFHLFVDHRDNAEKRARGRLDGIEILPGHGPVAAAQFRPTTDVFGSIAKGLERAGRDWLSFWRAYALVRVHTSTQRKLLDAALMRTEMKPLKDHLEVNFLVNSTDDWRFTHTQAVLELLDDPLNGLCRDLLLDLNRALVLQNRKLWILYDDLDQDIMEDSPWQSDALGGLLRLSYDANNQGLHNVRFKIFLREDIWSRLVFTNKSHFGPDRTLLLEWRITDFLRLAYRMASGGSAKYKLLAQREFPLTDEEIDSATDDDLNKVLAPLWGLRKEKSKNQSTARWVYSRMTDAANNSYPRSLVILLAAARADELRARNAKIGARSSTGSDRLLGPPAMLVGLREASVERVNALKNEYPRLKPFLDAVEKGQALRSQFGRVELEQLWRQTTPESGEDFGVFVDELKQSGLLVEKKTNSTYEYGIASLYIDGLGVQRVQGEKK